MKSLDQLRSLSGSIYGSGGRKTIPSMSSSRSSSSDSVSLGNFSNLKLTAEKLVKEHASVKTDLEMVLMALLLLRHALKITNPDGDDEDVSIFSSVSLALLYYGVGIQYLAKAKTETGSINTSRH